MISSPDQHVQGIERTSSIRGPSSRSSESRASDVKGAASVDEEPRIHICPTCSKRFNRPSSLRAHLIITHTSTTLFRCLFPNCGREFIVYSNLRRHYRNHTSPRLSRAQSVEPRQLEGRRQTHDPDHVFVTGGTSGQPLPLPFNDLDSCHPHQDSMRHLSRTLEFSDDSEDGQDHQSPTDFHRCNDDYRHTRHLPVSRSHAPHTTSNEDTHVAFQSKKSYLHSPTHISMVSSPSQSDTDPRLDVNITMSPRKRRRMSIDFASELSPSPPSSSSDNNMSPGTSNPVLSFVDYPFSNHSSFYSLHRNSSESSSVGSPIHESHYSPNHGNSTTSNAPFNIGLNKHLSSSRSHIADIEQGLDSANRTYPLGTLKKTPRRRYDEIERLYRCSWPNCTKAYATLTHLNAHIIMQKHGPKRNPNEFKELRKQWREAKKKAEVSHPVGVPAGRSDNTGPNMYSPTYNGGSSSPNVQSNDGSNSNGMDKTFPDWLNWPSAMTTNGKWSRSCSPKSGSSSVSDFSQSPLFYPSPSYNRSRSSPNSQSNTSYNGSNSKGVTDTFSNWSNYPFPVAPENRSRPGSAQSGSSGGRSDSP